MKLDYDDTEIYTEIELREIRYYLDKNYFILRCVLDGIPKKIIITPDQLTVGEKTSLKTHLWNVIRKHTEIIHTGNPLKLLD